MSDDFSTVRGRQIATRAEGFLELGMPERAMDEIRRANRERVFFDPHLLYLEGEVYRQMKRYREALFPLGQALLLEPRNTRVWLLIGYCQKRIGRCDLAIESLENALYMDPNSPLILYNLACYLALANRVDQCLETLSRAILIDAKLRHAAQTETDFDGLRENPDFVALTALTDDKN